MPIDLKPVDSITYLPYDVALRAEMKHGKAKSKAASKASGKKSSKSSAAVKVSAKSSKASPVVSKKQEAGKSSGGSSKSSAPANGKPVRLAPGDVHFTNATVGNAFKRAVKKYPNTFRRLTD